MTGLVISLAFVLGLYSIGLTAQDPVFWAFVALWMARAIQLNHKVTWQVMLLWHQMSSSEKSSISSRIEQYLQEHPEKRERD